MDWRSVLDRHGVSYTLTGKGTDVQLQCPFCGESDRGQHLGISLRGKGWNCWRNDTHRGRSPIRLLQALLRCSPEYARQVAGLDVGPVMSEEPLSQQVGKLLGGSVEQLPTKRLEMPENFKVLKPTGLGAIFWKYLRSRNYSDGEVCWLTEKYDLRYALQGEYRYRLIIPVRDAVGNLLTWTARTVVSDVQPRYKTLSTKDTIYRVTPTTNALLGMNLLIKCQQPKKLILCEGPFDAIRVTALGWRNGVYGTCLFGQNVSPAQVELIEELSTRFSKIYLLLDSDAALKALRIVDKLSGLRIRPLALPGNVKDPAELIREDFDAVVGCV